MVMNPMVQNKNHHLKQIQGLIAEISHGSGKLVPFINIRKNRTGVERHAPTYIPSFYLLISLSLTSKRTSELLSKKRTLPDASAARSLAWDLAVTLEQVLW